MNRRYFMKSGSIALASFGMMTSAPSFLKRALAQTANTTRRKTLIAIFQRGAVDGLNVVVPYGEHAYYDLRPNIAIPKPDAGAGLIQAAVGFEAARDCPCVRIAGQHPVAFRRAELHGIGDPRCEVDK